MDSSKEKLDNLQDLIYEISKKLEVLNHSVDIINQEVSKIRQMTDSHHDILMLQQGMQQSKTTFINWLSRHGIAIIGTIMALGAIMWELKKMTP